MKNSCIFILFTFIFLSITSVLEAQEKFLRVKGEVVNRYSEKERVKDVDIIVVNNRKDTLLKDNSKNGKFNFWLPVNQIMDVYFYTGEYYPKYFIVNTQSVPEFFKNETYEIEAEISLTPFDEGLINATPFDEPVGYVNFSAGRKVFFWDEQYTNEIRRYMNLAYIEQARVRADEWLTNEKAFVAESKSKSTFVIPSATTFVLQFVFKQIPYNLAMDKKDLRKAKLVKEWGVFLGGMIDVNKEYLLQFSDKETIQKADNLIYSVTEIKKAKELYIVPLEPNTLLAENLFFKLGQWMELTHFAMQVVPEEPIIIWNIIGHILLADNLEVASYLSDSILSFMADVKTFKSQCEEFEKLIKDNGLKGFELHKSKFDSLVKNFKTLYNKV